MTGSDANIESSELARALERDQREQRQEDESAIQREGQVVDRLATELANRRGGHPAS